MPSVRNLNISRFPSSEVSSTDMISFNFGLSAPTTPRKDIRLKLRGKECIPLQFCRSITSAAGLPLSSSPRRSVSWRPDRGTCSPPTIPVFEAAIEGIFHSQHGRPFFAFIAGLGGGERPHIHYNERSARGNFMPSYGYAANQDSECVVSEPSPPKTMNSLFRCSMRWRG